MTMFVLGLFDADAYNVFFSVFFSLFFFNSLTFRQFDVFDSLIWLFDDDDVNLIRSERLNSSFVENFQGQIFSENLSKEQN